tara:strand:- start:194 stop:397 length:204 start_codon:yes stop_codon:yes gene_type:complete
MTKSKELGQIEDRVYQLEIALQNLMLVVANQDELLPEFTKNLNYAKKITDETSSLIDLYTMNDEAEA